MKKKIAVLFGGRSPEHDVSIVTGLQALNAVDASRYDTFPVYVTTEGHWHVGEVLRERSFYVPNAEKLKSCERVTLDLNANATGQGRLVPFESKGLFSKKKPVEFDAAIPAFHGYFGEDGRIQSLLEIANVPYTGMRPLACAVFMDKGATKHLLHSADIPLLAFHVIDRPHDGLYLSEEALAEAASKVSFPAIVKPLRLGSSIGVARVTNADELRDAAGEIFRMDTQAILEPFVENLVEYNVSVARIGGKTVTSAIERPKSTKELLDFKEKYLSGGGKGGAKTKTPASSSEGMLSLTRDINPDIGAEAEANIRKWAAACFDRGQGSGAPRIDFVSNRKTGEIWLNEVNPTPGSFAYFLWEAAQKPMLFSDLLNHMIEEAFAIHRASQLPADPTHKDARIFNRD